MPGQCLKAPFSLAPTCCRCVDRACVRERPGIRGASGTVLYRLIACQVGDIRRSRARRPRSSRVPDFRANGGNEQGMHAVSTRDGWTSACAARAGALRVQRRTARLVPNWLKDPATRTLHLAGTPRQVGDATSQTGARLAEGFRSDRAVGVMFRAVPFDLPDDTVRSQFRCASMLPRINCDTAAFSTSVRTRPVDCASCLPAMPVTRGGQS